MNKILLVEDDAVIAFATKAVVQYWPRPAMSLTASHRGRRNSSETDVALRVTPQGHNERANRVGLFVWPNMRAPIGSPIHRAFITDEEQNELEQLGDWEASSGKSLTAMEVFTSARCIGGLVYAIMSI
jgi:hypothetical protein